MSTNWKEGVRKYGLLYDVLVKHFPVLANIPLRELETIPNLDLEGLGLDKIKNVCNCDFGNFR